MSRTPGLLSLQPSTPASPRVDPPTDSLQLPLPPTTLTFGFPGKVKRLQAFRYNRAGTRFDAQKAVIGKGGFGTAYRFERDDSFTPPSSFEGQLPSKSQTSLAHDLSLAPLTPPRSPITGKPISPHQATSTLPAVVMMGAQQSGSNGEHGRHNAPAVIIVKVCRTPSTGSFDEMPKTGLGRSVAKAADVALSKGDTAGFHTRIVRGEARLLRFLQMMAKREGKGPTETSLVRLLADLPVKMAEDGTAMVDDGDLPPEQLSGPVPRLLIFERLVDLDSVLTPEGWSKKQRQWTFQEVEDVSRDIAGGLAFLHTNHIVHGDLKPSNVMRDAKTGSAKLIDLGASRRFVCVPNQYKESTTAVEELDQFIEEGTLPPQTAQMIHTEGLGSLTGSPYFMAPEVLLQAGRYLDRQGLSRSVLHDYINCQSLLPATIDRSHFSMAFEDFKRGWGIKADIWSWACSVLALLLKTLTPEQKRPSSTICPFSFSFDAVSPGEFLEPRHRLHRTERNLPRFHEWARVCPIIIIKTVTEGVMLPPEASSLSSAALEMLSLSFQHMDQRPSATVIHKVLSAVVRDSSGSPNNRVLSLERRHSLTPSVQSETGSMMSHVGSAHNVDLRQSPVRTNSYASGIQRASYSECSALQPFPRLGGRAGDRSSSSTMSTAQDSITSSPASATMSLPDVGDRPTLADSLANDADEDSEMQDVMTAPIVVGPSDSDVMQIDSTNALDGLASDGNQGSGFLDKTRTRIRSLLPRRNTVTKQNNGETDSGKSEGRARGETITANNFHQQTPAQRIAEEVAKENAAEPPAEHRDALNGPPSATLPSFTRSDVPQATTTPKRRRSVLVLHSLSRRVSQTFAPNSVGNSPNSNPNSIEPMQEIASETAPTPGPSPASLAQQAGEHRPGLAERMKRKSFAKLRNSTTKTKEEK
ncbi:unnamed protein product [Sympodiomycopsis kandeliae]